MTKRILLALFFLSFTAQKCGEQDDGAKRKTHPGCPGDSARSSEDASACVCGKGEVMRAGAMECSDCDPVPSDGVYCDCGKNDVFSFNAVLDGLLKLSSPQLQCEAKRDDCPAGTYPVGATACNDCQPDDCGVCGPCSVGSTCVSGKCVAAVECRIRSVSPAYLNPGDQYDDRTIDPSACDHGKGDVCGFGLLQDFPTGEACGCNDSVGCGYDGISEPLSQ